MLEQPKQFYPTLMRAVKSVKQSSGNGPTDKAKVLCAGAHFLLIG
ncbi:hypothetical protein VCR4J2_570011 [Vibrio coralliirubri]|nr:hypothetical protein VCR4J2_570011 [Vibrio coralliirubri]